MTKISASHNQIRDFRPDDFPAVLNIWEATNMSGAERDDDLMVIERSLLSGGRLLVMEARDTNEIIGTAWITNNGRRLYIHHFGIKPEYQNMGLGYQLGLRCLDFAREKKMQIKLEVHHSNAAAINLYKNLGFKYLDGYEVLINRDP